MHILATFATLCYQTQWPPNHSCTTRGQNVPFWAIFGHPPLFGHFGPFWAILGIFGPFWPFLAPPGPPGAHFRARIPPHIPENIPAHIGDEKKNPAHIPEEENLPPHTPRKCPPNIFPPHTPRKTPPRKSAQNSPRTFLRPKSGHKFRANSPAHICAQIPRTQILRRVLRTKNCDAEISVG